MKRRERKGGNKIQRQTHLGNLALQSRKIIQLTGREDTEGYRYGYIHIQMYRYYRQLMPVWQASLVIYDEVMSHL